MFFTHFAQLVAISVGAGVVLAAPEIVVFPVDYQTWDYYQPVGCVSKPTNTGSFIVGACKDLDVYSGKFTPNTPVGASCVLHYWNAPKCKGVQSEAVPLANDVQSSCSVPTFDGVLQGMFPQDVEAHSVQVLCEYN